MSTQATPAEPARWQAVDTWITTAVGLTALALYATALAVGFTSDDFFILIRLQQLDGLRHPLAYFIAPGFFEYYRPIAFLSQAVDWHVWGLNASGYHLTNILLHAGTSAMVSVLGWRLGGRTTALVAGLLFAIHPASQEAVYWVSARFDLLATFFALAALLLFSGRSRGYAAALAACALALLSKESALALPPILLAYDLVVRRVDRNRALWRIGPVLVIALGYALLRSHFGALAAGGGMARVPKILMLAGLTIAVLWVAGRRRRAPSAPATAGRWRLAAAIGAATVTIAGLVIPSVSPWVRAKIGFAAFGAYYLTTPVAVPPAPASWFDLPDAGVSVVELLILFAIAGAAWRARRWLVDQPPALFAVVFIIAALIPVSSMTMSPRYLYLVFVGVALLGGLAANAIRGLRHRRAVAVSVGGLVVLSAIQILAAGSSWRWASTMTRESIDLMRPALRPCGAHDIIVLTAPVAVRGVYSNLNAVGLEVFDCAPASFTTVIRVMNTDTHVDVTIRGSLIEMRTPIDHGNLVAPGDLRRGDLPLVEAAPIVIDTPAGRLETERQDAGRILRLMLNERAQAAALFYYSDGRLHALAR